MKIFFVMTALMAGAGASSFAAMHGYGDDYERQKTPVHRPSDLDKQIELERLKIERLRLERNEIVWENLPDRLRDWTPAHVRAVKKEADKGNPDAICELGRVYVKGYGGEEIKPNSGKDLLEKAERLGVPSATKYLRIYRRDGLIF